MGAGNGGRDDLQQVDDIIHIAVALSPACNSAAL
jgi:hypothetical protein